MVHFKSTCILSVIKSKHSAGNLTVVLAEVVVTEYPDSLSKLGTNVKERNDVYHC